MLTLIYSTKFDLRSHMARERKVAHAFLFECFEFFISSSLLPLRQCDREKFSDISVFGIFQSFDVQNWTERKQEFPTVLHRKTETNSETHCLNCHHIHE